MDQVAHCIRSCFGTSLNPDLPKKAAYGNNTHQGRLESVKDLATNPRWYTLPVADRSEIAPAPVGNEPPWIELHNPANRKIEVQDFSLVINDESKYVLPRNLPPIPPRVFILLRFDGQNQMVGDYEFEDRFARIAFALQVARRAKTSRWPDRRLYQETPGSGTTNGIRSLERTRLPEEPDPGSSPYLEETLVRPAGQLTYANITFINRDNGDIIVNAQPIPVEFLDTDSAQTCCWRQTPTEVNEKVQNPQQF